MIRAGFPRQKTIIDRFPIKEGMFFEEILAYEMLFSVMDNPDAVKKPIKREKPKGGEKD